MLVLIAILALVLYLVEKYTLQYALHQVYYDCEPSEHLIDPDESFTLTTTVENHKPMMVPFVRMVEDLPYDLEPQVDEKTLYRGRQMLQMNSNFYLMPRQVYTRKVEVRLPKRGCHYFRNASLYGGDFMGLKENSKQYTYFKEVVVMPRSIESPVLDKTLGDYLGDLSVNRFILEDPVLTIGFREYTGREPQRAISWVQSARFGKMMVKNYDHTLDLSLTILLNVKTPLRTEESEERVEQCFSLVRAVCETMEEKQVKYKFSTNATISGYAGNWSDVNEGLGGNHFRTVMEGLGRAISYATEPFSATVERAYRQAEQGRSFIIVTPQIDEEWGAELKKLQEISSAPVCILTPDLLDTEQNDSEEVSA